MPVTTTTSRPATTEPVRAFAAGDAAASTFRATRWWLRVVGSLYLLMAAGNLYGMLGDQAMIRDGIPFDADDAVVHAFIDAWQIFILALVTLGAMAWVASARPARSGMLVATICLGEALFGIVGDVVLMARGYSASGYVPFIGFHLVVIATGVAVIVRDRLLSE